MAALRSFSRLLSRRSITRTPIRTFADEMKFTLAAGNEVFYNEESVKQIDVPSFSGVFGILPKHVPTLAVLKPGVVTVFENDGHLKKYFVSSGTVSINEDSSVQLIAEEACELQDLDLTSAKEALARAQGDQSKATTEQEKAEAAIAIEVAEELVKAAAATP